MPEARSEGAAGRPVEILNTGHLGYSPEQYYYSLIEYARRFPPRFVVVSLFANDFGDFQEVLEGKGRLAGGELLARPDPGLLSWPAISTALLFRPRGSTRSKGRRWPGTTPARSPTSWRRPGPHISTRSPNSPTPSSRSSTMPNAWAWLPRGIRSLTDGSATATSRRSGCEIWAAAVGRRLALLIEKRDLANAESSRVQTGRPAAATNPKGTLSQSSRYSPITLTSTRLALRPSNSP